MKFNPADNYLERNGEFVMSAERKTLDKYNVVVVDDELEITDLIVEELNNDYSVTSFNSPEQLVKALSENKVDPAVLVTDLKMPGMTGLKMLGEVKKLNYKVPTVMFSGYLEKDDVIEAVELGVVHILEKPIDISKVKEAVDATLIDFKLMQKRRELKELVKQLSEMHTAFRLAVENHIPYELMHNNVLTPDGKGFTIQSFDSMFDLLEEKIDGLIREEDVLYRLKDAQKLK